MTEEEARTAFVLLALDLGFSAAQIRAIVALVEGYDVNSNPETRG